VFLAEFAPPAEALCPRGTLKRVLARAKNMGYSAQASAEYEFFLFEETPHSVRAAPDRAREKHRGGSRLRPTD